ncbi:hypothetical protein LG296_05315 [Ureibacillus chungkukjangi]|uniref:hypothetical protein n=1 Tax=Ureibacillus chungkukjangi TaxID=1202712 RepID=UPI0020400DF8|nr:hypothetical protein [Ureibacillus chungkukjangi]MCM3386565.1 hypothetical protein [Ureibacillus chungkukjangi]
MISTDTWWEKIFSGPLSVGLNEERLHQLKDESFLFLKEDEEELPQGVLDQQQIDY